MFNFDIEKIFKLVEDLRGKKMNVSKFKNFYNTKRNDVVLLFAFEEAMSNIISPVVKQLELLNKKMDDTKDVDLLKEKLELALKEIDELKKANKKKTTPIKSKK